MSNLSTEGSVVHEEDIKVSNATNNEFFKTVGEIVSSLFVRSVSDFGHFFVASESSSHSVIDTYVS